MWLSAIFTLQSNIIRMISDPDITLKKKMKQNEMGENKENVSKLY